MIHSLTKVLGDEGWGGKWYGIKSIKDGNDVCNRPYTADKTWREARRRLLVLVINVISQTITRHNHGTPLEKPKTHGFRVPIFVYRHMLI